HPDHVRLWILQDPAAGILHIILRHGGGRGRGNAATDPISGRPRGQGEMMLNRPKKFARAMVAPAPTSVMNPIMSACGEPLQSFGRRMKLIINRMIARGAEPTMAMATHLGGVQPSM